MRQNHVTVHKGGEVTKAREGHERRVSDLFRALLDSSAPTIRLADESKHGITMVGRTSSSDGRG